MNLLFHSGVQRVQVEFPFDINYIVFEWKQLILLSYSFLYFTPNVTNFMS